MSRLAQLEKLLAVDPGDAFVLYGIAQEHAKAGDAAKAVEFFDRCIAADGSYCYAYYHKARTLMSQGNADAARCTAKEGLTAAERAGDGKAAGELAALLDELGGSWA